MKWLYDHIGWIEHYPGFGWTGFFWRRVFERHYSVKSTDKILSVPERDTLLREVELLRADRDRWQALAFLRRDILLECESKSLAHEEQVAKDQDEISLLRGALELASRAELDVRDALNRCERELESARAALKHTNADYDHRERLWVSERDTLNVIIVDLQHQTRELRHDRDEWKVKYENECKLRLRDLHRERNSLREALGCSPFTSEADVLDEMIAFADTLDPDLGPLFGRDVARVLRAIRPALAAPVEPCEPLPTKPDPTIVRFEDDATKVAYENFGTREEN